MQEHAARRRGQRPGRAGGGGLHAALPVAALISVYDAGEGLLLLPAGGPVPGQSGVCK